MRVAAELLEVLACPQTHAPLVYFPRGERDDDEAHGFLLSPRAALRFPVEAGLPILLVEEAQSLGADEVARLLARAKELGLTS